VDMRAWPVPPPGDDEVTVRVHSAGMNFRDALMAMSLMPVESFENSCAGKCLGKSPLNPALDVGMG
jgi:NADPH:quinone reductase-like Zn-dependent oxidoreductase